MRERLLEMHKYGVLALAVALLAACGGSGRPTGPPAPVADTIRTIEGQLQHFTTGPTFNAPDADGRYIPVTGFRPSQFPSGARFIAIEILAPDGSVMGANRTDESGHFSIPVNFGKNPATQVMVRATARVDLPFGAIATVRPAVGAPAYSHQTPLGGNPDDKVMQVDLTIPLDDGAAAYSILRTIYDGFVVARSGINAGMPDLDILWAPGNGDTSAFRVVSAALGELTIAGGIAGKLASNVDAWDPPKIMRLFGEYLFGYFFNETAPDGTPTDTKLVPSAAWREGWLDFWSCVARGSSIYWDTEGLGDEGRVTRYFDIESFFDPALGSLGPDDPNVYQPTSVVGIGSAFSIAEILWDIHDEDSPFTNDNDGVEFPLFLTLQFMRIPRPGFSYPYLYTLFAQYVADGSITAVKLDILMRSPENQGLYYPPTQQNALIWPPRFAPDDNPAGPAAPPFDKTLVDRLDTLTPDPVNLEIGELSQRYFIIDLLFDSDLTASLVTNGTMVIDVLDLQNRLIASGPSPLSVEDLPPGQYIIRVRSEAAPQNELFDLRVQITAPD